MHVPPHSARRAHLLAPYEGVLVSGVQRQLALGLRTRPAESEVRVAHRDHDPAPLGHQGPQIAQYGAHLLVALDRAEHAPADHEVERSRRRHLAPLMREPQLMQLATPRSPARSMSRTGVVAEDRHPLARQLLHEPPVAAAVVEHPLGPSDHLEHDIRLRLIAARRSTDSLVESVESVKLRGLGAAQHAAHDRLEVRAARPATGQPRPPAHHRVLALALQRNEVGAVVDEPHPPIHHPEVVRMEVATDDTVAPALGEQIDHAGPVATGVGSLDSNG